MARMKTIKTLVPAPVEMPRGARWAADIASAIWRGLEALGRARAQRELRQLADRSDARDPEYARRLRDASRFSVCR